MIESIGSHDIAPPTKLSKYHDISRTKSHDIAPPTATCLTLTLAHSAVLGEECFCT